MLALLTMVRALHSGMRLRTIIASIVLGLLFPVTGYCQTSMDALGGASDAAQGVFDRISGNAIEKTDTVYAVVQEQPRYPGGMEALGAYLQANVHYPKEELEAGIQGRVFVAFVVRKDGTVSDVELLHGAGPAMDAEAIRAVKAMPSWIPGSMDGTPVNVRSTIPIVFSIPGPGTPSKD
jgi:TonB family protein